MKHPHARSRNAVNFSKPGEYVGGIDPRARPPSRPGLLCSLFDTLLLRPSPGVETASRLALPLLNNGSLPHVVIYGSSENLMSHNIIASACLVILFADFRG